MKTIYPLLRRLFNRRARQRDIIRIFREPFDDPRDKSGQYMRSIQQRRT